LVSGRRAATGRGGGARRRGGVEAGLRIGAGAGRWGGGGMLAEMPFEPLDGPLRVPTAQVHSQVDRAAAALGGVPVKEFRAGDRKRATRGAPLGLVVAVTHGAPGGQDDFQRDFPNQVGSPPEVVSGHGTFLR